VQREGGTNGAAGAGAAGLGRSLEEIQERWVVGGDRMLDEETA
jgi:hypothetical protein